MTALNDRGKEPNTTTQEIKKLQKLVSEGATLLSVADAMGWPFQRVQYWEKRLGIRFQRGGRPVLSIKDKAKLRRCAERGMSLDTAALNMNWDRDKVRYWEKRLYIHFVRMRKVGEHGV